MNPSFFENKRYWVHELDGINSNIPKNRISIKNLTLLKEKGFNTKDGFQYISNEEFDSICNFFSSDLYDKILLPLVLLQKRDHFVTSGNKYAVWAVEVLMGHETSNNIISIADYQPKYGYYYSYQVNKLRRRFPTIIQLVFSMS